MRDWEVIKEKNQEKLEQLNLPSFSPKIKIMILDKYCPYSLNEVIKIKSCKRYNDNDYGMHGTWAAQVIKAVAGENIEFYGAGWEGTDGLREVIEFCLKNDIKIISASINFFYSKEREEILKQFYDMGGVFVTSAGNKSRSRVKYPGNSKYTICVSATNSSDADGEEIDIAADSYWYVRNLKDGYFTSFNGTSCSVPVIAGCIAYIITKHPNWHCEDVRKFLKENSTMDMRYLEEYERFFSFSDSFEEVESMEIKLKIDSPTYTVDGKEKTMDTAPFIKDNRTFVPIRFIAEFLGCKVEWDEDKREVIIKK